MCFALDEFPTFASNEGVAEIVNALVGGNVGHKDLDRLCERNGCFRVSLPNIVKSNPDCTCRKFTIFFECKKMANSFEFRHFSFLMVRICDC